MGFGGHYCLALYFLLSLTSWNLYFEQAMHMKSSCYIGTSGWMYDHWKEEFYPPEISSDEMLAFFGRHFKTVEVNNIFYQKPDRKKILGWKESVPDDFTFAIKANRYITHMKNLKDVKEPVSELLSVLRGLGKKLGPVLFQLPPQWHINAPRIKSFLNILPKGFRYAMEFRHDSWYDKEIFKSLRERNIAFCIHDHKDAPSPEKVTADFIYLRLHGPGGYYSSKYTDEQLSRWSEKIKKWLSEGKDIYAYFNNDTSGYAIRNSDQLKKKIWKKKNSKNI
ncbi:MAG: DUF72 domain-containing protein [Candidatus Nealsonbacteria bacterium]|nr:DUF72 domain-containing protein [Candidatus Nealsonbacteria bacterium]